jgi:hypothetical protein
MAMFDLVVSGGTYVLSGRAECGSTIAGGNLVAIGNGLRRWPELVVEDGS